MRETLRPQKSSTKAKAAVNKIKGAATTATPPSDESDETKVKNETEVGEDPEVERTSPSCSAKSNFDKIYGDGDDRTGIESIMVAAAAVSALSGPAWRK
jgi:hypothetical protein